MTNPYDQKPDSKGEKPVDQPKPESDDSKRLSLDDLVSRDAKSYVAFTQDQGAKQKLPGSDLNRYISKGLTADLSRELSGQKANPPLNEAPREFKWSGAKGVGSPASSSLDNFSPGAKPFFQLRKSEFAKPDEKPSMQFKFEVDKFLRDTSPKEDKTLTPAEIQELTQTRNLIQQSNNPEEVLSNTLHLARLYQHLRYIEEAKKAVEFSLGIDPEHMLGKQVFKELERMHPADVGASASHVVSPLLTKTILRQRIAAMTGGRVVVVGDLLIDELLEGKPERISREAPVLILEHVDTELIPGGAANTAHNISSLGGICHAVGVCGSDEYARKLARLLEGCGISHSLVQDPSRPTTVKTRILSKSHSLMQQLLRLDRISHEPLSAEIEAKLIGRLRESTAGFKAIVLSDYRAGVITDGMIDACRQLARTQNILLIVDAQGDFERFKDVTLMTPNQPDTEKAVGYKLTNLDDLRKAGNQILQSTNAKALLVTRGADGMVLFQQGQELVELPAFNRSDVFDVTGAGDTVVGTMALALVSGATFVESMALGNLAAGIVVRKSGTAVTSQKELLENLERLNLPEG